MGEGGSQFRLYPASDIHVAEVSGAVPQRTPRFAEA